MGNNDEFKFVYSIPESSKNKIPKIILPYGTLRVQTSIGCTEMAIKMMRWIELLTNYDFE